MSKPTILERLRRLSPKTLKANLSAGITTALVPPQWSLVAALFPAAALAMAPWQEPST